jgi:hypothetical protein
MCQHMPSDSRRQGLKVLYFIRLRCKEDSMHMQGASAANSADNRRSGVAGRTGCAPEKGKGVMSPHFHFEHLPRPPQLLGMERMKKTAPTEAVGSVLDGCQEAKTETLVDYL